MINIGCGEDISVRELAERIQEIVGFKGGLILDPTKPHNTSRKLLDLSRIRAVGREVRTSLREEITAINKAYLSSRTFTCDRPIEAVRVSR
jgi:GDP-L-fucose synthase